MKRNVIFALFMLLSLILGGCASVPDITEDGQSILATTTFLADITRNVAGERARVDSLLPPGADPHAYQLTPSDVARIADSTVLIQNGIGYEHFLKTTLENTDGNRLVIIASDGLEPRAVDDPEHEEGDPHMWLDPNLVITYVENIRDGLIKSDPEGAAIYTANAESYIDQLHSLDAWIVEQAAVIPDERRLLVTNHESLGYFADRYGFKMVGAVIPGLSSGASTSARNLAEIVDLIRSFDVPAIFLDEVESPDLANQIAAETGVSVVYDLHLESLTESAPAATYIAMMQYNVSRIVEALK